MKKLLKKKKIFRIIIKQIKMKDNNNKKPQELQNLKKKYKKFLKVN